MAAVEYGRLEVVDLLLAKDPKASSLRGANGTTCIHLAAGGASTRILELLLKASPELALEVDEDGLDAMCWAARGGRLEAIMVLANHGLSISGASHSLQTPLEIAITSGFMDVARELINRGADVEVDRIVDANYQRTSLIVAALGDQKQAVEFLLEHGADPYLRDVFGFCAADYFLENGWSKDFPQLHLSDYRPLDRSTQLAILQHTIVNTSEQIISKKGSQSDGAKQDSIHLLDILTYAMLLFRSKTSLTYLQQALAERLHDKTYTINCRFCRRGIESQSFFICLKYGTAQALCPSCHESYLQSSAEAGSLPVNILLLKELELAVLRVLKVMEIFKHDDGKNISKCLRSVTLAAHWIGAVLSVYRQFAFDPSLQGETFLDYLPVYTREFVLLLETIKKFRWSPADELSSLEQEKQGTAIEAIVRGLNEVYDGFRPNYNPAPFFYHGHRYIRIDNERSKAEASKYLDDNKELRPSFYEDVIAYYANLESNEIDDLIEDDPLPVCSNRQEGDNDRMWESIRSLHFGLATEAFPRFLDKTIRDNWVDESLEQLRETLEPLYYKREALGENTAQVRIVDKEIEVYEVAWKMVHAMLDIPFERTVWEEKQYQQEKWSNARRMAASEEVMSDDGSEDSWHTANDAALDEEDSDSACRIGEAES